MTADEPWEARCAELWAAMETYSEPDFVAAIDALVAELPGGSPIGLFERGAAQDSTGHSDRAVELYTAALETGLAGVRRRRAVIQKASSLRNMDRPQEALALLEAEATEPADELGGAVATFTALLLADLGREREGLAIAVTALAGYLPRYNASAARYAQALLDDDHRHQSS